MAAGADVREARVLALRAALGGEARRRRRAARGAPHARRLGGRALSTAARAGVEPDARRGCKNASWLEDAAVRLLCVLSLDRFGTTWATASSRPCARPARAPGAGCSLSRRAPSRRSSVYPGAAPAPEWEVRHSALLALGTCSPRARVAPRLLPAALPAATAALDDKDDDVRGAAAEALLPAARHLPTHRDFPPLLAGLWTLLGRLDDPDLLTSPSNVPVMRLVSALYALPATRATPPRGPGSALRDVVPSLFPFAAHPIAAVRLAVWQTLGQPAARDGRATAEARTPAPRLPSAAPATTGWTPRRRRRCASRSRRPCWRRTPRPPPRRRRRGATCHVASAGAVAAAVDAHVEGWCALAATAPDARPDARLLCVVSLSGGAGGTITGADDRAPTSTSEWVVTTAGRLRAVAALSQLAKVLCAPGNDDGVDDAGRAGGRPENRKRRTRLGSRQAGGAGHAPVVEGSATRRMTGRSCSRPGWTPSRRARPSLRWRSRARDWASSSPRRTRRTRRRLRRRRTRRWLRWWRASSASPPACRAAADNNVRPTTRRCRRRRRTGSAPRTPRRSRRRFRRCVVVVYPYLPFARVFLARVFRFRFRGFGSARLIFFPTAKRRTDRSFGFVALGTPRRRSGRAVAVRRGHHPRAPTSEVFAARERAQQVSPRLALAGVK